MSDVLIYSSNLCPFCYRAKALLKGKGVSYREVNVDLNPKARAEMRNKAGGRNSVPQVFIGSEHVGGCDDLYALDSVGGLDAMLQGAA